MPELLPHVPAIVITLLLAMALLPCQAGDDKKQPAPTGTIEGKIMIDGKPLPAGTVGFHSAKGKAVVGPVNPDGTYTIKEIAPGMYRVTITIEAAKPAGPDKAPAKDKTEPKVKDAAKGGTAKDSARYVPIPRKYRDPKTTPLSVEVQAGKQVFDLQLRK